jgi:hypothetical protein
MSHPKFFLLESLGYFLELRICKGRFLVSISLPFHFPSSSFWRQKEGKTARLTQLRLKRKILPLHPQNSPCTSRDYLVRFRVMLPSLILLGLMWLEQLRLRTLQDLSFFLRNGSPAKAGINRLLNGDANPITFINIASIT